MLETTHSTSIAHFLMPFSPFVCKSTYQWRLLNYKYSQCAWDLLLPIVFLWVNAYGKKIAWVYSEQMSGSVILQAMLYINVIAESIILGASQHWNLRTDICCSVIDGQSSTTRCRDGRMAQSIGKQGRDDSIKQFSIQPPTSFLITGDYDCRVGVYIEQSFLPCCPTFCLSANATFIMLFTLAYLSWQTTDLHHCM